MSGILDNKSRVIDAILTQEGRRQMAEGTFSVNYATFTDSSVVYQRNDDEGHEDATNKIYLQAFNVPQDQIIFEADDSGNLMPFRQHMGSSYLNNGRIINRTSLSGEAYSEEVVYGADFASQIEGILSSSVENFKNLRIIGTVDPLFEDKEFAISPNEVFFTIKNDTNSIQMKLPTNINTVDSLFNDEKLRNVDNFKYLPPIVKTSPYIDKTNIQGLIDANLLLGRYPAWGPTEKLSFSQIKKELEKYEASSRTIYFDPTSRDNEIVAQFFEINNSTVKKLDVIDYGKTSVNSLNPKSSTNHIFFVGKVLLDDTGSDCFIHLFTLVFSLAEEQ